MRKKKAEQTEPIIQATAEVPAAKPVSRKIMNHRVSPTDTLSGIAKRYGVTKDALICANLAEYPSIAAGTVLPGWTLTIISEK